MNQITNINIINGIIFLKDIIFIYLIGSSKGGAVFIDYQNTNVFISDSIFLNCSVTNIGGGIYSNNLLNFSLLKSCGFRCTSNYDGQFSYINVINNINNYNQINFSSSQLCGYDHTFPLYTLTINNGISICYYLNSTKNYINNHFGGIGSISGYIFKISFSTFYQIKNSMVICCGGGFSTNQEFEFVNIIETEAYGTYYRIIHLNSYSSIKLKLKKFIFLKNNGYINDAMNGIIEYENCYFDLWTTVRGTSHFQKCITTSIIPKLNIIHLNTIYCYGNTKSFSNFIEYYLFKFLFIFFLNFYICSISFFFFFFKNKIKNFIL